MRILIRKAFLKEAPDPELVQGNPCRGALRRAFYLRRIYAT